MEPLKQRPAASLIDTGMDGHVHSRLCGHAEGEMEEYVLAALEKGLSGLTFLEHFETGINYFEKTWLDEAEFAYYQEELERLRAKYGDRIYLGVGVETGYNPDYPERIAAFLKSFSWDRVGLSYHYLKLEGGRHVNVVSRKASNTELLSRRGADEVINMYLSGLLEAVTLLDADVVCHLDAAMRHNPEAAFGQSHFDRIRDIFDVMAVKEMALEINTSGYPLRGKPYPGPDILKLAMEMGIRLAPGSDAHQPGDVGRYFARLPDYLAETSDLIQP